LQVVVGELLGPAPDQDVADIAGLDVRPERLDADVEEVRRFF